MHNVVHHGCCRHGHPTYPRHLTDVLEPGPPVGSIVTLKHCVLYYSIAALVYIARWAPAVLLPGSVLGLLMATATGAVLGATGVVVLLVSNT